MQSNKTDLLLVGNITIDEVYSVGKWPKEDTSNTFSSYRQSIGGIGNILEALKGKDIKIGVETPVGKDQDGRVISKYLWETQNAPYLSSKPTTKSVILSNLSSNERTSFVNWGCGIDPWPMKFNTAMWGHISYLDVLPLIAKYVKKRCQILSADLCLSNPTSKQISTVLSQLEYLDYLFLSESEIIKYACVKDRSINFVLEKLIKSGVKNIVLHSRSHTYIQTKNGVIPIKGMHTVVKKTDVLGAGDAYCGNFILYMLNNPKNVIEAAHFAHKEATKFISRL